MLLQSMASAGLSSVVHAHEGGGSGGAISRTHESAPTILVVDNEAIHYTLWSAILKRKGYEVVTASNGKAALEILTTRKVDGLITDVNMPVMDGIALLTKIKEIPSVYAMLKGIVVLSGKQENKNSILSLGVEKAVFYLKPADPDDVLRSLKTFFS